MAEQRPTPEFGIPDPEAFIQVHYRIGLALWRIQAFEDVLAFYIAIILKMPPSRAEGAARRVLENLQKMTLGSLLAELRKGNSTNYVTTFETRLKSFLDERNWLVHHSWREHHGDLFAPLRLPPLLARLSNIEREASYLLKFFSELATRWTLTQGISQEQLHNATLDELNKRGVI